MQCPEGIWQFWWNHSAQAPVVLVVPDAVSVSQMEAEGSPLDPLCCVVWITIPGQSQRLQTSSQALLEILCTAEYPLMNSFSASISQDWILLSAAKKPFNRPSKLCGF